MIYKLSGDWRGVGGARRTNPSMRIACRGFQRKRGILPGDLVVARKQNTAEVGDIIVAIYKECVTLKKYGRQRSTYSSNRCAKTFVPSSCR